MTLLRSRQRILEVINSLVPSILVPGYPDLSIININPHAHIGGQNTNLPHHDKTHKYCFLLELGQVNIVTEVDRRFVLSSTPIVIVRQSVLSSFVREDADEGFSVAVTRKSQHFVCLVPRVRN
jgi:hypothetical protein